MTIYEQQELLDLLGYNPSGNQPPKIRRTFVDGIDGPITRKALDSFRQDYGCGEDGLVGALAGTVVKLDRPTFDDLVEDTISSEDFWDDIEFVPRHEWRCPCGRCGGFPAEPQEGIVRFIDELRKHFGKPVTISSGVRCKAHNAELPGSVSNSRHLTGKAVDFCVQGMSATSVKVYCDKFVKSGVLRYCYCIDGNFVHADIL